METFDEKLVLSLKGMCLHRNRSLHRICSFPAGLSNDITNAELNELLNYLLYATFSTKHILQPMQNFWGMAWIFVFRRAIRAQTLGIPKLQLWATLQI